MAEQNDAQQRIANVSRLRDTRVLEVQRVPCATCIYRADSPLEIAALEADVTDPKRPGQFTGYRACHHASASRNVCCRGFWNRHKDTFLLGVLASWLGRVVFVTVDDRQGLRRLRNVARRNAPDGSERGRV